MPELLAKNFRELLLELAALVLLLVAVLLPFFGPLSHGQTLSKLSLLCDIDLAQDANKSFAIHEDPSAATTHIPIERYIDQTVELALWNPNNGAGRPIIGDFQTLIFSFLHSCFPAQDPFLASLGILFKISTAAAGSFFLSRRLGISRLASMAVGQAFALAPHHLASTELCNNFCFYPWLILLSIWCLDKSTPTRIVLLGLVCAASAYNMHPETFVCGVGAALLFASVRVACRAEKGERRAQLGRVILTVSTVSLLAFLLAAPLILPFCEFIANGVSYKFLDTHIDYINLSSFVCNLIAPFSGSSNFIGVALFACLLLGIFSAWRREAAVPIAFCAALLFTTRPGVLEWLLGQKPVSFLLPEYTSYFCILFASLAGGFGLDAVLRAAKLSVAKNDNATTTKKQRLILLLPPFLLFAIAILVNSPIFWAGWSDLTSFGYEANTSVFSLFYLASQTSIFIVLLGAAALSDERIKRYSTTLAALIVLFNAMPLLQNASHELNGSKPYWYHNAEIIQTLKKRQQGLPFRSTATGEHLVQPNTNLIFGFDDFRSTAPLHPRRYADFADACGIKSRNCNIYGSPYQLNHLYDLASVKLVMSDAPVHSAELNGRQIEMGKPIAAKFEPGIKIRPGLRLDSAEFKYYPSSHEISGECLLALHMTGRFSYYYQWILQDDSSKPLWKSPWQAGTIEQLALDKGKHRYAIELSAPVPLKTDSKTIRVVLKIRTGSSVDSPSRRDRSLLLAKFGLQVLAEAQSKGRIRRIAETADGMQVYENRSALPNAYLVHHIKIANTPEEALKLVQEEKFDWQKSAIIEDLGPVPDAMAGAHTASAQPAGEQKDLVRILDKDSNNVLILSKSKEAAYLILTDTLYPGWTVYVDGKAAKIKAANFAFRSVNLGPGQHFVCFTYEPKSLSFGLNCFLFGLLSSTAILLWQAIAAMKEGLQFSQQRFLSSHALAVPHLDGLSSSKMAKNDNNPHRLLKDGK